MNEVWVTLAEARDRLNLSESTIRRRIAAGEIQSKSSGGRRLVCLSDLTEVTDEMTGLKESLTDKAKLIESLESDKERLQQQVDLLQEELSQSRGRQDTIILQLTKQIDQFTALEDKRSWIKRLFYKKNA